MSHQFSGKFLRYSEGRNIYEFDCPLCGGFGEIGVKRNDNNRIFRHGDHCPALFVQKPPIGMFGKPEVIFINPEEEKN